MKRCGTELYSSTFPWQIFFAIIITGNIIMYYEGNTEGNHEDISRYDYKK